MVPGGLGMGQLKRVDNSFDSKSFDSGDCCEDLASMIKSSAETRDVELADLEAKFMKKITDSDSVRDEELADLEKIVNQVCK
jgi:hypothetical protein